MNNEKQKITLANKLKCEKGGGLVWIYLTIVVLGLSSAGVYSVSTWQSRLVGIDISRERAFYLSEAGLDQKLFELRQGSIPETTPATYSGSDGSYTATFDVSNQTLTSVGSYNGASRTIVTKIVKSIPPGVKGALSGNGDVSTNGGINIDGRDYDVNGNIVGPGTYGISTSGTYSQSGSSTVGGNNIAPAHPAEVGTVEESTPAMAATPEELLGLAPGALDAYKTTELPTLPMNNEIVYLTANSGSGQPNIWNGPDFGTAENPSTGILIFHNTDGDAKLKNLKGHFQGIIITDDIEHINNQVEIYGAVMVIAPDSNFGNGNADVYYSTEAIRNTPLSANYSIVSWEDMLN